MPAAFTDEFMDKSLDFYATATRIYLCSDQPDNFTEASDTLALAEATLTGGDFTKANGDTDGRKSTRAAKTGITVAASGTGTFVAYVVLADSKLLSSFPCNAVVVTEDGEVDLGAHALTLRDPA